MSREYIVKQTTKIVDTWVVRASTREEAIRKVEADSLGYEPDVLDGRIAGHGRMTARLNRGPRHFASTTEEGGS